MPEPVFGTMGVNPGGPDQRDHDAQPIRLQDRLRAVRFRAGFGGRHNMARATGGLRSDLCPLARGVAMSSPIVQRLLLPQLRQRGRAARTTIYLLVVAKVFETREEAETWVAAWSGAKSSACEGLKSPSGGLPYAATGSVSNRPTSVSHSIDSAGIPAEREATSLAEWLSRSIPAPSRPSEPKQSG